LRAGLVGKSDEVAEQVSRFAEAGVDLLLLQCSPQLEEMERFAAEVIAPAVAA
jgi:FMNH2-dependent dimethyl sulfone monooxygenase